MAINRQLLLALSALLRHAFCAMELVGDEAKWDAIFASREAELVASGFQWPEGPRWNDDAAEVYNSDGTRSRFRVFQPSRARYENGTMPHLLELDTDGVCFARDRVDTLLRQHSFELSPTPPSRPRLSALQSLLFARASR